MADCILGFSGLGWSNLLQDYLNLQESIKPAFPFESLPPPSLNSSGVKRSFSLSHILNCLSLSSFSSRGVRPGMYSLATSPYNWALISLPY